MEDDYRASETDSEDTQELGTVSSAQMQQMDDDEPQSPPSNQS